MPTKIKHIDLSKIVN